MTWTSNAGIRIPDLVPASLRRAWVVAGWCPDRDLYSLFADHVRNHPTRDAVIDDEGVLSYQALAELTARYIAALLGHDLGVGDIIGISLRNGRAAVAAELAVAAVGAVALPYPGRGARDTVSLLGRSRAAAVIADRPLPVAALPYLRAVVTAGVETARPPSVRIDPDTPARIVVSSGSEADPKMVAYSHNAFAGGRATYVRSLGTPMRNLVLVPLSSSFGSCGVPVTVAALGETLLVQSAFDPAAALSMIETHAPSHLIGVPTMLRRIADLGVSADTSSLRAVVSSGAALPEATATACRDRFGVPVITVYGSSDGVNCHAVAGEGHHGRPNPAVTTIAVTDDKGDEVEPGTPGEICALGPMTPMSYLAAPALNNTLRSPGGWIRTGDRGVLDESGHLHVLGRIKNVVIRGGATISPAEVEHLLAEHPDVAEVACVGIPDPDLGERLCACVVQPAGVAPLTVRSAAEYLSTHHGLDKHKLPEHVLLLRELPVTATGKVCPRSLTTLATARLT